MLNAWANSEVDYIADVSTPATFNFTRALYTPSAEFAVKPISKIKTKINPILYLYFNKWVEPASEARRYLTSEEDGLLWSALNDATTLISKGRLLK